MRRHLWVLLLLGAVAACSKSTDMSAAPMAEAGQAALVGQGNEAGSFLAYSHQASIRLPAADITGRVAAVRKACMERVHGTCTVLGEQQSAGQYPAGRLVMRAEPKAIEPLVAMAAQGAEVSQRSTEAEDLADAVRDNGLRQARLRTQHTRLSEFLERRDIKAEDLIALSNQLAQIEAELQMAEQESAQQQRRIRTNLLTLEFASESVTVESSELGSSLGEVVEVLDSSLAVLVTLLAAALPFVVFFGLVWMFICWRVRRRRRLAG